MTIEIRKCTCEHDFQDKQYGKGNRVWNQTLKDKGTVYRCTVCTKEKTLTSIRHEPLNI